LTNVSANGVYHFDVKRVTPYATLGIGIERSHISSDRPEDLALLTPSSTEFSFNVGGGVKYPMSPRFLARADLRRFQSNDLAPDYWRLYGGVTFWIKR
jgi:opacity protein-like surface antigen